MHKNAREKFDILCVNNHEKNNPVKTKEEKSQSLKNILIRKSINITLNQKIKHILINIICLIIFMI